MTCASPARRQDVGQLARLLLTVLVEDGLRARLATAGRATALQFAPSIIADRCVPGLDAFLLLETSRDDNLSVATHGRGWQTTWGPELLVCRLTYAL